jgi:HSP20 family protein
MFSGANKMMTMYMTPYRRIVNSDRIARNIGNIHSDVHVPMDIIDEKDAFVIYATLPGLKAEDVAIEIVDNTVDIRGEFKQEVDEEINFLRRERPTGSFQRNLRFGTKLEAAKADAQLVDGILTLRVPKVEEALPKTIKVKTK